MERGNGRGAGSHLSLSRCHGTGWVFTRELVDQAALSRRAAVQLRTGTTLWAEAQMQMHALHGAQTELYRIIIEIMW